MSENISNLFGSTAKAMFAAPMWGARQMGKMANPAFPAAAAAFAARRSIEGIRTGASPARSLASATELRNKSRVYGLVRANQFLLKIPPQGNELFPLEKYLPRALETDAYSSLWALEGLGRLYGTSYLNAGVEPVGILRKGTAPPLPESAMLVLHAGVGLSFAKVLLDRIGDSASKPEVRDTVERIIGLCRANAEEGYLLGSLEALGLVVRVFHPQLLESVVDAIDDFAPEVIGVFWHGVGRAVYFVPINFLPFSTWDTIETARRLGGGDRMIRDNTISGAVSAMVMVNVRSPEVVAHLVIDPHGGKLLDEPGFTHGVATSIIMRQITTPGAPFIRGFFEYSPTCASKKFTERWDKLVRTPGRRGLEFHTPGLKSQNKIDLICEFGDLDAQVA